MQPHSDERLARFAKERDHLNARLDETRAQISEWITTAQGQGGSADFAELATIEGLLATRRDYLTELIKLDDAFVDYLLTLRAEPPNADTSDAARDATEQLG